MIRYMSKVGLGDLSPEELLQVRRIINMSQQCYSIQIHAGSYKSVLSSGIMKPEFYLSLNC